MTEAEIVFNDKGEITKDTFKDLPPLPPFSPKVKIRKPVLLSEKDDRPYRGKDNVFSHDPSAYSRNGKTHVGALIPAQDMIPPQELYATSFTPKGSFISRVAPRNSVRNGWEFRPEKKSREPLKRSLYKKLTNLTYEYDIKQNSTIAMQVAEIFGRSLLYRRQVSPKGKVKRWELFVTYLPDEWVEYDEETNEILYYRPIVGWARGVRMLMIDPKDAVLFIAEKDPMGNGFQGISQLITSHRTIMRSENVEESWADTVSNRGLGILDIEIMNADTEDELKPWAAKYKDPSTFKTMVHNDQVKVKTEEGMRANFNLDETVGRYTKDISSATGYPSMRMEGVQSGNVTGSETDKDNMAEQYACIQERYEKAIIDTYKMLDDSLTGEKFVLEFILDLKLDVAKKSQIFATDSNSVMTIQDIMTVDQALEMLRLPPWPKSEEGSLTIAEFIDKKSTVGTKINRNISYTDDPDKKEFGEKEEKGTPDPTGDPGTFTNPNEEGDSDEMLDLFDWLNLAVKELDKDDAIDLFITYLPRYKINETHTKEQLAEMLSKAGMDSDSLLSYGKINIVLREIYGSGKSPNWLKAKRYE